MHKSLVTIDSPEFINLQPLEVNPLMSACEIKVLYLGENRNGSFISKEVATEMSKTLRGAPIVGYWKTEANDFGDHGERVIIDGDGIRFECLTIPYGFVSPDAKVWFQKFEDINDFGEKTIREYLMTTGYLWTGQFEECKAAVEGEGKPHSMELDEDSLDGHWSTNNKGMDFFIINDATFSKLCILGENVEPCFEGSSIKAPDVSTSFTKVDDAFKQTLFSMMQDLKTALKGGQQMEDNVPVVEQPVVSTEPAPANTPPAAPPEPTVEPEPIAAPEPTVDPAPSVEPEPAPEPEGPSIEEQFSALQEEHDALKDKYTNLEASFNQLQSNYSGLEQSYNALVAFKKKIDDAQKDEMINKFAMLSDDEKQEVIENKDKYSVAEIEEKLSVICFRKGNFNLSNNTIFQNNTEVPVVTFNMNTGITDTATPAWIKAVENVKNNKI